MTIRIKTSDTELVEVSTFKNAKGKFVNVRKFWRKKGGGKADWQVGRQGFTISEEFARKVIKAMRTEFDDIENAEELPERGSKKSSSKDED
jgi:hypothetical protein